MTDCLWESVDFSACAKNHVLFASDGSGAAGRNVTSRRSSANPRRSKKLKEMRSASLLHNLRSAMKPLSLYFKEPGSSHRRKISWYHTRQPPFRPAVWAREPLMSSKIHYCADSGTIESVFRTIISVISSVFTEQSQKCVKNVNPAMIEQRDLLWNDNPTHCSCQV